MLQPKCTTFLEVVVEGLNNEKSYRWVFLKILAIKLANW